MEKALRKQLDALPLRPGVYLFRDKDDSILYIGKAKRLRSRVRSYFAESADLEPSKQVMVRNVRTIDHIIVDTEIEALLLEANLIKKHRPPFNIILKDDKSFLFLKIDLSQKYPPVEMVRRPTKAKNVKLYGPFTSAYALRNTLKYLKRIFPYRDCGKGPDEQCFDVHLGRCIGHDLGPDSAKAYRETLQQLMNFLSGTKQQDIVNKLERTMKDASATKHYEAAAVARDRLKELERVLADQKMISVIGEHHDVISIARNHMAAINLFVVRNGKLLSKKNVLLEHIKDQTNADILYSFISQYYGVATDIPKTILVPEVPTDAPTLQTLTNATFTVPRRGHKRKLMKLGETNAKDYLKRMEIDLASSRSKAEKSLRELQRVLSLNKSPRRIEVYDISNIQGTDPVGSMIVFQDGLSKRDAYRKFQIKTKQLPDDTAMMTEMLTRRVKHLSTKDKNRWPRPDLIVVDGGKGQLGAARSVLTAAKLSVPLIALAKRDEEVFVPGRAAPLKLSKRSDALFLLQRMRDEAHRFAIGYFRFRHTTASVKSALDEIPGIGPATKKKLLKQFGSVASIRKASTDDLMRTIGKKKTIILQEHLS